MANTALTAGDLTTLRSPIQSVTEVTVFNTPLTTVATATISSISSLSPLVAVVVSWVGGSADVKVGQLIKITSSGSLIAWAVVRKAVSGNNLYISTTPTGSGGYAVNIESAIATGQDVTIYSHHPMWGLYSTIRNRTFYKQWDVAYASQTSTPPPVSNAGAWQGATVTAGSSATFTLPMKGANESYAMAGSISSYLWTLPTGVSLASGYATSDDVIQVTATQGNHLIRLTVTDSGARTHDSYVWLFVADRTNNLSLSDACAVQITGDTQDQRGRTMNLLVTGSSAEIESRLFAGAGILFKEDTFYSDGSLSVGKPVTTFIGYIQSVIYTYSDTGRITADVVVASPMIYAEQVLIPEQSLTHKSSPANWAEATLANMTPRGILYYLAKWHVPALIDMHDFIIDETSPQRKFIDIPAKNLGESLGTVAMQFLLTIGSASDGTTISGSMLNYLDNTDRSAVATVCTILSQDIQSPLSYQRRMIQAFSEARTGAFAYDGTNTNGWYAMKRWQQGIGQTEMPSFTVSSSDGVTRVKEVVGHYLAEQNADIMSIDLNMNRNFDVFDPAYAVWYQLTVSSEYDPRGIGFTTQRLICRTVNRQWDQSSGLLIKRVSASFTLETFGQAGEEVTFASGGAYTSNGTSVSSVVPYTPNKQTFISTGGTGGGFVLLLSRAGKLAVSFNIQDIYPVWADLTGYISGTICDACLDYNSAYFTGGYNPADAISLYVLATDSTTLTLYRIDDIRTPSGVTTVTTWTMADANTSLHGARVVSSRESNAFVVVAWHDRTGVEVDRSTDGGATWAGAANVGSAITDISANDDLALGLAVYDTKQLITAPDSTPEYGLYYASTTGGAFSALTNTVRHTNLAPMVLAVDGSTAYYAERATGGATYDLDFESLPNTGVTYSANRNDSIAYTDYELYQTDAGGSSEYVRWDIRSIQDGNLIIAGSTSTGSLPSTKGIKIAYSGTISSFSFKFQAYPNTGSYTGTPVTFTLYDDTGTRVSKWSNTYNDYTAWQTVTPSFTAFSVTTDLVLEYTISAGAGASSHTIRIDDIAINGTTLTFQDVPFNDLGTFNQTMVDTGSFSNTFMAGSGFPSYQGVGSYLASGGNPTGYFASQRDSGFTWCDAIIAVSMPTGGVTSLQIDWRAWWASGTPATGAIAFTIYGGLSGTRTTYLSTTKDASSSWATFDMSADGGWTNVPDVGTDFLIYVYANNSGGTGLGYPVKVHIDNVIVNNNVATYTLHKVATYGATDTWSDVTPDAHIPTYPYDASCDILDSTILFVADGNDKYFRTTDSGSSWTTLETGSDRKTTIAGGKVWIIGGDEYLRITLSNGSSFTVKTGNLSSIWGGAIGILKRIIAL